MICVFSDKKILCKSRVLKDLLHLLVLSVSICVTLFVHAATGTVHRMVDACTRGLLVSSDHKT